MHFTPFTTTPGAIRTGNVIRTPWSPALTSLEVETVTHELFTAPNGERYPVVRFTGWELFDGMPIHYGDEQAHRVIDGWGTRPEVEVDVVAEVRPFTFGALSGRGNADQLATELAEFLASLSGK